MKVEDLKVTMGLSGGRTFADSLRVMSSLLDRTYNSIRDVEIAVNRIMVYLHKPHRIVCPCCQYTGGSKSAFHVLCPVCDGMRTIPAGEWIIETIQEQVMADATEMSLRTPRSLGQALYYIYSLVQLYGFNYREHLGRYGL